MSVLEYAQDVNKSVSYILDMCKKLDIKVSGEEDILDDDAIVMLDNAISSDEPEESSDSEDLVDEEILKKMDDDDYYDEVIDTMVDKKISNYNKDRVKKNKNKQNKNIKAAKKAMYKNKEKLVSNSNTNDNIVLYKENMTIKELAKAFAKEADMYQKMMERQDAKIVALDEKMANIANKWQDKAKEPTQKSFEENLHRFEKEAEMENQNTNPQ